MNKAALQLAGYSSLEEFLSLGKSCQETFCPAPLGKCPVWDEGQLFDKTERPFLLRDGEEIRVMKSAVPIDIEGETMMLEGIIDLRKQAELEEIAFKDPLTGVFNRQGAEYSLEKMYREALREGKDFSLMLLDMDKFKEINDVHGHYAGDKALQFFSSVAQKWIRHHGIFGRWGGDEFVAGVYNGEKDSVLLAETILTEVQKGFSIGKNRRISLSASVGVATLISGTDIWRSYQRGRHVHVFSKEKGRRGGVFARSFRVFSKSSGLGRKA